MTLSTQPDLFSWNPQSPQIGAHCGPAIRSAEADSRCAVSGAQFPPHTPPKCGVRTLEEVVGPRSQGPQPGRPRLDAGGLTDLTDGYPSDRGEVSRSPILRPYQRSAIAGVNARFAAGDHRTLVVLPTGTGKTVCFAELARETVARDLRVLVLAHRTELLEQAQRKLADVGVKARIEKADQHAGRSPVVVASVATLQGRRLDKLDPKEFGLLVVDEGHHAVAESYKRILDRFAAVPTVLVTATADRADGKGLDEVCASVAYRYELRAAIADKWLVPLVARRIVVDGLDLSRVKTRAGDLDAKELGAIMRLEANLHGVVDPLMRESNGRRTIVFAVDVAHAHALAAVINRHEPGAALAVDGTASDAQRKAVLAMFRHGEIRFLVNCALFTEGFDEPSLSCVAIARPTKSRILHTQMIGRGTRLFDGKRDCLVLDFVGNTGRHRLIGPVDALAGNADLAENVRDAVECMLSEKQGELEDVLAAAEAEVARKQKDAGLVAIAHYRSTEVDLFLGADMLPVGKDPWPGQMATPAQIAALVTAGLGIPPQGLGKHEASRMIDAIARRNAAGLATVKQRKLLTKLGIETKDMTNKRAQQLIGRCAVQGFRPFVLMGEPEFRGRLGR